ncbi:uncharacterized protein [Eucyclogobius newberryi]|uniref:uncharacterized protein n=1 Tax=Eucyclogobius newberryi TaxID=166745 RepID=UPI003B593B13
MAALGSLSAVGGSVLSVVEQFLDQKNHLDQIAADLKNIRDRASDRSADLGRRVHREQENGATLGLLVGLVAAPLTGGASLALGAGLGVGLGVGVGIGAAVGGVSVHNNVERVYERDRRLNGEDRDRMRTLLSEFQLKVKNMRLAVKFIRRFFLRHRLDTTRLVQMERLINELIEDIDMSSSLQSLQRVSENCKRVMNQLEETLEDVQVELYFHTRFPELQN